MRLRAFVLGGILAFSAIGVSAGGVLAYGSADSPLAQLELSANCTNASSPLCAPSAFGLGGIWLWIEVDSGGTADVAGAGCGHLPGFGGGAGSIKGEFPWVSFSGTQSALQTAFPGVLAVGTDPAGQYYVLPEFGFAFPTTTGHYSLRLDKGVFLQSQVAP